MVNLQLIYKVKTKNITMACWFQTINIFVRVKDTSIIISEPQFLGKGTMNKHKTDTTANEMTQTIVKVIKIRIGIAKAYKAYVVKHFYPI